MDNLLEYEKEEISKHNYECYYSGENFFKLKSPKLYTLENGMYELLKNNHIQFKYQIIEKLGTGQYGVVCKVFDHSCLKERALKILRKKVSYIPSYEIEVTNLLFLRSKLPENESKFEELIPQIFDYFTFRDHKVMVLNYYSQNLYDSIIKKKKLLDLNKIKVIIQDLTDTLVYLQKYNIIHGDIKPENILFRNANSWNIVLIDYGLSIKDNDNELYSIQSMWYRAPEIIFKIPYDFRIDLWSLGCVIYELYYGIAAFRAKKEINLLEEIYKKLSAPSNEYLEYISIYLNQNNSVLNFNKIYKNLEKKYKYKRIEFNVTSNTNADYYITELIDKIFVYNPNKRITYEEILNSNFFKN